MAELSIGYQNTTATQDKMKEFNSERAFETVELYGWELEEECVSAKKKTGRK